MASLEDLTRGTSVKGILPDALVTVVDVKWIGNAAIELTYKDSTGRLGSELIYRDREATLEVVTSGRPWSFDGDGRMFRLVSEAKRIGMAYLFDPAARSPHLPGRTASAPDHGGLPGNAAPPAASIFACG